MLWPVQGVPGVVYPAWPIFGSCFRGLLQTEQKGSVFHLEAWWVKDPFRYPPSCSMSYVLRRWPKGTGASSVSAAPSGTWCSGCARWEKRGLKRREDEDVSWWCWWGACYWFVASTGSQPDAGSPKVSTGCGFTFMNTSVWRQVAGVNRMLVHPSDARAETDTLSRRELTESEEDSANGHVTSSACAHREGAKRAVSALVDVASSGPGGGDLPQTRRHTASRTLKEKRPTLTRQKTAAWLTAPHPVQTRTRSLTRPHVCGKPPEGGGSDCAVCLQVESFAAGGLGGVKWSWLPTALEAWGCRSEKGRHPVERKCDGRTHWRGATPLCGRISGHTDAPDRLAECCPCLDGPARGTIIINRVQAFWV